MADKLPIRGRPKAAPHGSAKPSTPNGKSDD